MGYAIKVDVFLSDMHCGECDVRFAMPETLRKECERTGRAWHCPNGHARVYRETDAQRLQKKLDEAMRTNTALAERVANAEAAEQRAVDEKRRLLRRANAGVCPCCNRTFQNVQRHMATKHASEKLPAPPTPEPLAATPPRKRGRPRKVPA